MRKGRLLGYGVGSHRLDGMIFCSGDGPDTVSVGGCSDELDGNAAKSPSEKSVEAR